MRTVASFTILDSLFFISFLFLINIVMTGCAEVVPPPGGEIDKSPPYIISTTPLNGQLLTPRGNSVTIIFSERLVKPQSGQSIFISPKQKTEPKIDWKSDAIIISFADSFQTNSTYIISFSSDIKDLRGNRLDSNLTIAFRTGNKLSSGKVSGFVYAENKPQAGMMVGLYDSELMNDSSRIDSLAPDYIVYTNKKGFFQFKYLPEKNFHLLAFKDKDKDNQFDLYRESFAIPDKLINLSTVEMIESLNLPLNKLDSSKLEILSAYYDQNSLLKIKLNKEVEIGDNFFGIYMTSNDTTESIVHSKKPVALVQSGEQYASLFTAFFPYLKDNLYYIIFRKSDELNTVDLVLKDFPLTRKIDKESPKIISFWPDSLTQLTNDFDIVVTFSEPIDTTRLTSETFSLYQDSLTRVEISPKQINVFQLSFKSDKLQYGKNYQFRIVEFEIADSQGNLLGDSLISFPITIANRDSLGTMSGEVIVNTLDKEDDKIILVAENYETKEKYILNLYKNKFLNELLPGKYKLTAFIDSDGNGKRTLGKAFPYSLSETFAVYPDTVKVRPRFEVAEIKFELK